MDQHSSHTSDGPGGRKASRRRPSATPGLVKLARGAEIEGAEGRGATTVEEKRKLLADLCKLLGRRLGATVAPAGQEPPSIPPLPPRTRQVLDLLLAGMSEKEVAARLGISAHTVHVHVKSLYKRLEVSSRGELLARCLGQPRR